MNVEYTTIASYFECKSKMIGKIATYDLIIEALEKTLMQSVDSSLYLQTELDDGQVKLRVQYRSLKDINTAMEGLIKLRQYYVNRLSNRVTRLVGGQL